MTSVSLTDAGLRELEELTVLAPELALRRAVPLLTRLTDGRAFMDEYIFPLLEEPIEADEWFVARRLEGEEGSFSVEIFIWPPGTRTQIHDHSSWGALRCVVGSVLEERYERLDDGSLFEHARLEKVWQFPWGRGDGVSTVLPGDGGIHRVGNVGKNTAISVHLYGPRLAEIDGRDYDPSQNYVCDRGIA